MRGAFLIAGDGGSAISFCDIACFNTYSYYRDMDNVTSGKKLKPNRATCFHCAACGRLIYEAIECIMHDSACPPWVWYAATPTVEDFLDAWEETTQSRTLRQEEWETVDRIAKANPLISGTDLAVITLNYLGL